MIEDPAGLDCSADTGVDAIGRDPTSGPRVVVKHRSRLERAQQREAANARLARGQPQRHVAADLGVARSTLQDWCQPTPVGAARRCWRRSWRPPKVCSGCTNWWWRRTLSSRCKVVPGCGWCANSWS